MADMTCPFCEEADFDEIGLCLHLSMHCPAYDRACRRTSDEVERRQSRPTPARPRSDANGNDHS